MVGLGTDTQFYPRMIGYILEYVLKSATARNFDEVIVITDNIPIRKKRDAVEKAIKTILKQKLPAAVKYRVLHHASKSTYGLQVADYCNWALFRKWEKGDTRSYDLIKSRVLSEYEIFRKGTTLYY